MTTEQIDRLIADNERLIYQSLHEFYPGTRITEDIVQLGRIALWKAAKTYDSEKGTFAHHAIMTVRYELGTHFRDQSRQKRVCEESAAHLDGPVPGTEEMVLGDTLEATPYSSFVDWGGIQAALSERDWEIFGYMLSGYSGQEIANVYGKTKQWASLRIQNIRRIAAEYV
jgi:DNA-directed RNA polymerase specialized sigma24 family protein